MGEPKPPDDKRNWKFIDIYLFSNGQQSSPPRKYHLVTDQLEWWTATLNYLAKSQYGSLHSNVDLYTIDGNKIDTPLELTHNSAYVAVLPKDLFIDAGYDKYLLRATRSWEKGQVRRASNITVVEPEEIQIASDKSNSESKTLEDPTKEVTENLENESVTLKTIIASVVDNQPSVIVKPRANKDKLIHNTDSTAVKLPDKPQRSSMQRTSMVKRNSISASPPSPPRFRKQSFRMKDTVKINTDTKNIQPDLTAGVNKVPVKGKIHKPIQKLKGSLPDPLLTKVKEIVHEVKSSTSLKTVHKRSSDARNTELESIVLEKNAPLIPNPDKDTDSEKPPTTENPDARLSDNVNVNRQGAEHELFLDFHRPSIETSCDKPRSIIASDTEISLLKTDTNDTTLIGLKISSPTLSKLTKTENEVVMICKEGVVNMKLNVEIWSNPNEVKITPNILSKRDSLITLKREKGSQIDIEVKSLTHEKNMINEKNTNGENHRVFVVNCTCLGHDGNYANNTFPVNKESTNFLVFLPVLKLDEGHRSCECKENKATSGTSINPGRTSMFSLQKEKAENFFSHSEVASKNNSMEIQVEANTIHDRNEFTTIKRKSVAIREHQETSPPERPMVLVSEILDHTKVTPEQDKSEFIVLKKESVASSGGILHKSTSKYTQTDWSDVLLEVKLQEDGHYTFHLPPVDMLKQYKM